MPLLLCSILVVVSATAVGGRDLLASDAFKVDELEMSMHRPRAPAPVLELVRQSSEGVNLELLSPGQHQLVRNIGSKMFGPIVLREGTAVYDAPLEIGDAVLVMRFVGPENAFFEWKHRELESPVGAAMFIDMSTFPEGPWTIECACVSATTTQALARYGSASLIC